MAYLVGYTAPQFIEKIYPTGQVRLESPVHKEKIVDTLSLFGGDENSSVDGEEMMDMAQDDEGNESNASGMVDIIRVDLIGEKSGYFFYRFEPQ